jgi:hypothetical protein
MTSPTWMIRRATVLGIAGATIAIVALSIATATTAAPAMNPLSVFVVNDPLSVTGTVDVDGTVEVAGNVGASQSGAWNVGISGTPAVTSADTTTLLGSFEGTVNGGGAFTEAVSFANASTSRAVRVLTNCFDGAACANILVRVYTVVGGRSYLVDQFPMQNFVVAGGVYDVIGANMSVQLLNNNAGPNTNIGVAVFGRAN